MAEESNKNEMSEEETKDLWERTKKIFQSTLTTDADRSQAERYLSMITSQKIDNNNIVLFASSEIAAKFIEENYGPNLKTCLGLASGRPDLEIVYKSQMTPKKPTVVPSATHYFNGSSAGPGSPRTVYAPGRVSTFISTMPLISEYTFDEFVTGPSNSWAHAAALGVVNEIGKDKNEYNPLLIYGGTGLGKTHLMQAVGNEVRKIMPEMSVCYLTAETFLNEFVNALKNNTMEQFHTRYRNIDLLLVDDIQFIAERNNFQVEFFNTFNALHGAKKHIILTSDVAPKNLHAFDQRLISRFVGGLVQEIEMPKYETRLAILRKKAEGSVPTVPENCLNFIAENIESHVRALNGALGKVKLMISSNPTLTFTDDMLKHLLAEFIESDNNLKKLTVEEIQQVVAKKYAVTIQQILSTERTQSIVTPRQLAMYIARKYTTKSLPEIARMFDKSHATIIHGVKTISKRLDVEPELHQSLEEIMKEMGAKFSEENV